MRRLLLATILCGFAASGITACVHGGKLRKDGDEWRERQSFIMRCDIDTDGSWKTSVVACLTPDSHERFHVNTVASDLSGSWCCKRKADGSVAMFPARPGLCKGEPERPLSTSRPTTTAPPPEPIEESIEEDEPIFPFPDDDSLEDIVAEEPTEPPYVPPPHTPPTFDYKSHHDQNNGAFARRFGSSLVVICLLALPYALYLA